MRNPFGCRFAVKRLRAACVGFTLLLAAAAARAQVITEFSAGIAPLASLHNIAAGPDGNLWFTGGIGNRIGRITPLGVVTLFNTGLSANAGVLGITGGPDGNVWFTEFNTRKIGRITPAGVITEFGGLTIGANPYDITSGPNGNLWFTENAGSRIGQITPLGAITEFSAGITASAEITSITTGPDGNLWFTERATAKIGTITPLGAVTEFSTGITANSQPTEITAGPDGNLWFTEQNPVAMGRITPLGAVTEFPASAFSLGAGLQGITGGPDGFVWFTEADVNKIGRISPAGVVAEFNINTNAQPLFITTGPDGNLWFTENLANRVGRITTGATPNEIFESDITGNKVNVFARTASGDVAPIRTLTSIFFNSTNGTAVDSVHDELFVSNGGGPSIEVYPRWANGNVLPSRRILGGLTGIASPLAVAVDPAANEIFVNDGGPPASIRVFARTANGNVAPLRTITGPSTGLAAGAGAMRIDRLHGEIIVTLQSGSVAFYPIGANGDQAPLRTIPVANPNGVVVDVVHDEVIVSQPLVPAVRAFSRSTGTLLRTITGASTGLVQTCGTLALDLDLFHDEIATTSCGTSGQTRIAFFSRTANGDVAPVRSISGASTGLTEPWDVVVTKAEVAPLQLLLDRTAGATSNGNGVLEPGETVTLDPTWHNQTILDAVLSGAFSNFMGPAGATYGIPAATANYGNLIAGTSKDCLTGTACPTLSLSVPAARPSQHWDATVQEMPSIQNLVALWHIHIGGSFADAPTTNGFYRFIETIFHNGITGGCSGGNYCPGDPATRAQMAVFLLLSKEGATYLPPPATGTLFTDVPASNGFAKWIEELANRGVTAGCGGGAYCPNASVTRAQMAVFLLVTKEGSAYVPPPATGIFADVPASNGFAKWIEELSRRGIAAGCGGGNFCPNNAVTRGQMAVFLTTTFSLVLNGL